MLQQIPETRCSTATVEFCAPFRLGAGHPELPAGSYVVHAYEDVFLGASEPVYVATSIELVETVAGRTSCHIAKPADLTSALARDAEWSASTGAPSENPDRGCS